MPTSAAQVLGCLYGAHALITQAQTLTADTSGSDLGPLLSALLAEIEAAEAELAHGLNRRIAELLPSGFTYSPD